MQQVPTPVDSVEFVVLVDNSLDSLSSVPKHVSLEWPRLMRHGMKELSGEGQCCANHGLSLVVTVRKEDVSHTVMFDAGPENYVLERNAPRLGVDFSTIEGIVLSHGHWDHAGGLPAAIRSTVSARGGRPIPVFVHPGMFRQRALTLPTGTILPIKAIANPSELTALGARVISSEQPQLILENLFWISGEIPRVTSYERGFPGHLRRSEDGSSWEADPLIIDERFLAVLRQRRCCLHRLLTCRGCKRVAKCSRHVVTTAASRRSRGFSSFRSKRANHSRDNSGPGCVWIDGDCSGSLHRLAGN